MPRFTDNVKVILDELGAGLKTHYSRSRQSLR